MEGVEPSSKRWTNTLSTCLSSLKFSCSNRTEATYSSLIPLSFGQDPGRVLPYSRYCCTTGSLKLQDESWGWCHVPTTVAGIKHRSTVLRSSSESVVVFARYGFNPEIKVRRINALHAYGPALTAVKTSHPQDIYFYKQASTSLLRCIVRSHTLVCSHPMRLAAS